MSSPSQPPLRFTGHKSLIHRLLISTLTGRPIRISKIRPSSPTNPGLAPHEVSLLRLLDAITNGSLIEFSYTGTDLGSASCDLARDVSRANRPTMIPYATSTPRSIPGSAR